MNVVKKIRQRIWVLLAVLLFPLFTGNVYGADNSPGWLRGLCLTTNKTICENGVKFMAKALRDSKLPGYRTGDKSFISEYLYDFNASSDAHITRDQFFDLLDSSYKRSTSKDMNVFYYIGHSLADDANGTNAGVYIGNKTGIPYGELLQKLASYKGKFIVIIDACWAGHIVTDGWDKLKSHQQDRFCFLLATVAEGEAHLEPFSKTHSFSQGLMDSISYNKKYKKLFPDDNQDGTLTVQEAWNNGSIKGHPIWSVSQQPRALGHTEFPLFQFNYIELDRSVIKGQSGKQYELKASLAIDDGTERIVKWGTSDASVVSVSTKEQKIGADGASVTLTLKNTGKAVIHAWMSDATTGKAIPDTFVYCTVTVTPFDLKDARITLSKTGYKYKGSELRPSVKVVYEGSTLKKGRDYTVAYKDNTYAGKAKAVITGTGKYEGTVTRKFSIKPVLTLSPSSIKLEKGKTKQLEVTVKGYRTKKAVKVKYNSSKPGVVKVSSKGMITAVRKGTAVITVSVGGVSKKCRCSVTDADYRSIYKKALEKGTFPYEDVGITITAKYFLLLNIDQKGVPELIVSDYADSVGNSGYIYTIRNGRLKYCGYYHHKGYRDFMYVKKYKSVYYSWWVNGIGGIGAQLLCLKNGKLQPYKYFYEGNESYTSSKRNYYIGKSGESYRKVSKKNYSSQKKKYLGKIKSYKYVANTKSNRDKKLGR